MKQLLGFLGFIAVAQGAAGLVTEFSGWRVGFVQRIGFLDGREVWASVALIVLGVALFAAAENRRSG
ncbi:hypothetical protein [Streptomyces viridosporus]|uniref:hypothetical protein n=1 Tax=Streptomyces viridosporus TaxID=67581 RepID=UPI0009BD403E|nr:hypothetical protein [Streptomyces viridosporus]